MIRLSILCFFVCSLTACGVRAPVSQFTKSKIMRSTPEAVVIEAEFEISNTNDEPLQLKNFNYTVTSGSQLLYKGLAAAQQTVPRWSSIQCRIPIVIRRNDFASNSPVAWKLIGTLAYIPPTALSQTLLKSGWWKPTMRVQGHGAFDMPGIN